ncbi:nuclear transport factor 2 family protein [Neobacillus drentensis]|uniref:nuclear transport factor 2 family protein n=1 Tax=Neobacillus drentensis TaxID=220684 RepID=UPI003001D46B
MEQSITSNLSFKEKDVSFLQLVASGKVREAYQRYIGPDFRHHNPYFRGDADSLMLAMEENAALNPNKILEVKLAIQEKDTVAVHSHVKQHPEDLGGAVVHIFRFQDNKIVELWDIGQPIPEDSPNENGMF